MNKIIAGMITVAALAVSAQAKVTFSDDFKRDDTAQGEGLGAKWNTTGGIFLNSGVAKTQASGRQLAIYNGAVALNNSFSLKLNMYAQANGRYAGIVFHYIDSDNYYVLRTKFQDAAASVWQALKVEEGVQFILWEEPVGAGKMPLKSWRTLQLSETEKGAFHLKITNPSGTETYVDSSFYDSSLTGGTAGFIFDGSYVWAGKFELSAEEGAWPPVASM